MPNPSPDTNAQYGPFTEALTGPLTPQPTRTVNGYAPSGAGALASFAASFLQGAQHARRTNYERSEQAKQEADANFSKYYQEKMASPDISQEGKKELTRLHDLKYGSDLHEIVKAADPEHKDNPLMHLTKAIANSMVGPDQNTKHPTYDIGALASVANNEKYKIDPRAIGSQAATDVLGAIQKMRDGVQGREAYTPSGPSSGEMAAAQPGYLQSNVPGMGPVAPPQDFRQPVTPVTAVAPQDVNLDSVSMNRDIQAVHKRLLDLTGKGIGENPYTAEILSGIPKFAPPKVLKKDDFYQGADGQSHQSVLMQSSDGRTFWIDDTRPAAAQPKTVSGGAVRQNMRAVTLDDAIGLNKSNPGQYPYTGPDGKPLDLAEIRSVNPNAQIQEIFGPRGNYFQPYSPVFHQVRVGNEVYAVTSEQMAGLPAGKGVDLGVFNPGSTRYSPTILTDAGGSQIAVSLPSTTTPNTTGVAGRTAPPPGAATAAPNNYETKLGPEEEKQFQTWLDSQHQSGKIPDGDYNFYKKNGYGYDYDFRAAYKKGLTADPETGHWNDYGKKPNHQTFSDQSVYATAPGARPGHWEGNQFIPAPKTTAPPVSENQMNNDLAAKLATIQARVEGKADTALRQIPLPGMQPAERDKQLARLTPTLAASNQLFGDPTQPTLQGLNSFADLADNPESRQRLGTAFRLTMDRIQHSAAGGGSIMEWLKNQSGLSAAIADSRAQVQNDATLALTPREKEAYNATMASYGTIVGLRSISKASASAGSVAKIENELPVIGVNTNSRADFYNQLTKPADEIAGVMRTLSPQMFQGGQAEKDRYARVVPNLREAQRIVTNGRRTAAPPGAAPPAQAPPAQAPPAADAMVTLKVKGPDGKVEDLPVHRSQEKAAREKITSRKGYSVQ